MKKGGEELLTTVMEWVNEAASAIKQGLKETLVVETKTDRDDLVTNMDRWVEAFFTAKIKSEFPNDEIIGEEGEYRKADISKGNVWVIDPIDGTTNFVKQKDNFCIMISYFEDGIGKLAVINEVMENHMIYGGAGMGVYYDGLRVTAPEDSSLGDGLLGIGRKILLDYQELVKDVVSAALAIRVYGCTGIDLINVLTGKTVCFLGRLAPWDYAPGVVLGTELGFLFSTFDGQYPGFDQKELFIIAAPAAYREAMELMRQKSGFDS